ncbi:hypothetical protein PJP10_32465, partial [Mycobacterium kansasii]
FYQPWISFMNSGAKKGNQIRTYREQTYGENLSPNSFLMSTMGNRIFIYREQTYDDDYATYSFNSSS